MPLTPSTQAILLFVSNQTPYNGVTGTDSSSAWASTDWQSCYLISRHHRRAEGVWFDSSEMRSFVVAAAAAVSLQMPSTTDLIKAEPSHSVEVPLALPVFVYGCLSMYAKNAHQVFE